MVTNTAKQQVDTKTGFVAAWVALILIGIVIEFFGRYFGYENNPSQIFHTWMPQGTATLSAVILIAGYFVTFGNKAKLSNQRRRNGILLLIMGGIMLATSFLFKVAMPLIFG